MKGLMSSQPLSVISGEKMDRWLDFNAQTSMVVISWEMEE